MGYVARAGDGKVAQAGKIELSGIAGYLPGADDAVVIGLKTALEAERIRREEAEALAAERLQHIEDLRRMLPSPDRHPTGQQSRRWWQF